jgi:hypothetical protein
VLAINTLRVISCGLLMLLRDALILGAAFVAGGFAIAGQVQFTAPITLLFERNAFETLDSSSPGPLCSEWNLVGSSGIAVTVSLFPKTCVTWVCWSFRAPTSPSLLIASATWMFLRLDFEKLAFWFVTVLFWNKLLRFRGLIRASIVVL